MRMPKYTYGFISRVIKVDYFSCALNIVTRKERFEKVLGYFQEHVPMPETELHYDDPFQLLVAVILSAQCTDKRVNQTTPALFRAFPDATTLAAATPEDILPFIKSISYPNSKAKHLSSMAKMLVAEFNGRVPSSLKELMRLPGVGRKTANVIASVVFDQPALAVDTHVFRVTARIGLTVNAKNPLQCEEQLIKFIPEHLAARAHHWFILHGRYVCVARNPRCFECPLTLYCRYFEKKYRTQNSKQISNK
jgi:endonuclease III